MAKKSSGDPAAPKKLSTYTIKLDDTQMKKLRAACEAKSWEPFVVAYTHFAFKGPDCNVSAYTSGKVVVAGKGTEDFVQNVIEPEVTGQAKLGYDAVLHPEWFTAHAGLDESGKGDFFGPVIAATVIDELIRGTPGVVVETCSCGMMKYNELMGRPGANLNRLLAWQHATALNAALNQKWVPWGLLDQFTEQPLVQRELAKKATAQFDLKMRTKAEEDPVVAAASVVARAAFVREMHALSLRFGDKLQKGASAAVKAQAHEIIRRFGAPALREFAKLHFRTAYEVVSEAGKLDELPLKEPGEKMEWGKR